MESSGITPRDQARAVRIEPLAPHHSISAFDCGVLSLNEFLAKFAQGHPRQGLSQTWVIRAADDQTVLAFFSLSIGMVTLADATSRVAKGMPRHDIPCILLARLAVDLSVQGQGLGGVALEAAMRKAVELGRAPTMASGSPGLPLRALLVHALDDTAAAFYRHHGFEPSPTDSLHLLALLKDIDASFRAG